MYRRLLTPRWLLVHLVFLAAFFAACWLGLWQWERAQAAGGSFRNLGYALQWPLFGAFSLFLWYQVIRMSFDSDSSRRGTDTEQAAESPDTVAPADRPDDPSAELDGRAAEMPSRRPRRSPVPPPAPPVDSEEDPELAAYNRYLAELNAADESR